MKTLIDCTEKDFYNFMDNTNHSIRRDKQKNAIKFFNRDGEMIGYMIKGIWGDQSSYKILETKI